MPIAPSLRTGNHLLRLLGAVAESALSNQAPERRFAPGEPLPAAEGATALVWFPETMIARVMLTTCGRSTAIGLVGPESLIGGDALLGRAEAIAASAVM
ncbi:MAG: hypothetical protein JO290_11545, partial [Sphingomonadaceae bacterium]|nr:hypothetical protein [Sphingomonadaceae bacterium]